MDHKSASNGYIKSHRFQEAKEGLEIGVFFWFKGKMTDANVRRFLFGMSPNVAAFNACV